MLCECRTAGNDANDEASWYDACNDATWCSNATIPSSSITGYLQFSALFHFVITSAEGGYVFSSVCVSVCLSVCPSDK